MHQKRPPPHHSPHGPQRQPCCRPIAICFDLDGVLVDTMPCHARAWQDAANLFGLRVSQRAIYEWEGESGIVTAHTLLRRRGPRPSRREVATLLRWKEARFRQLASGVTVNPDLKQLLGRLRRRGVRLALVTGTSSQEVQRIVPSRVLAAFDVVVTGDRVRHGKPHPEPYRLALQQLHVRPDEAVVVENAPYGIQSARTVQAGLVVALRSSLPTPFLRSAHVIVPSVARLCRFLDRLTAQYGAHTEPGRGSWSKLRDTAESRRKRGRTWRSRTSAVLRLPAAPLRVAAQAGASAFPRCKST